MAITKAPRDIRVVVPRHNSQTIGAKLDVEIRRQAKAKSIRVDVAQPVPELAQAIESASEWNSLLMTARAERGPQWDIGTQQFLVEEGSDLYYDPTPLFEVTNKAREEEGVTSSSEPSHPPHNLNQPPPPSRDPGPHQGQFQVNPPRPQHQPQTPMRERDFHPPMGGQLMDPSPLRHGHPGGGMQGNFPGYPGTPGGMNAMNMRGTPGHVAGGAPQFNAMQQQFFAGGAPATPMRMNSMGGMPMDDHGMGMMGGMMQGGTPQMGRRMTRGGGPEEFMMH